MPDGCFEAALGTDGGSGERHAEVWTWSDHVQIVKIYRTSLKCSKLLTRKGKQIGGVFGEGVD